MIAIWLVMLVALVGLGSLAAVVFAIVYAIANKKPGVALAAVLLPLGVIVTVGVLGALLVGRASYHVQGPVHADIHYAIDAPPSPPSPPQISLPQMVEVKTHVRAWVFFLPIVVLIAAFMMFRKQGCKSGNWSWGKMLAVSMLLVLAANFFFASMSRRVEIVQGPQLGTAQMREDADTAARRGMEAQHRLADAQRKAADAVEEKAAQERGIEFKSMQELWEKLNQPRIKLESDEEGASMEAGVNGKVVKIEASEAGEAQFVVPISGETPESLSRSLARLERMVEQVSNMADQLSDAGTLVGKAMVVLNETIDQKRSRLETLEEQLDSVEADAATPVAAEKPVAAQEPATPQEHESPSVQPAAATKLVSTKVASPEVTTAEIETPVQADVEKISPPMAPRPDWVSTPAKRVGNAQRRVIVAGDFATREECDREADRLVMLATAEHLAAITGSPMPPTLQTDASVPNGWVLPQHSDPRLYLLERMNVGLDFVRREIAKDEYEETVELSFGPMKRLYTLVEFTPSVDNELRTRWDEFRREKRFAMVGIGAGSVLGLLGMAFGLLKVDTWTKGYYTKRLFLGVPAAIIGMLGLLGLAVS